MTTTVTVGGLTFSNTGVLDGEGCRWVLSRLDGWGESTGVRTQSQDRPQGHGSFAERAWRGGAVPVIEGTVICPSRPAAALVKRRLSALLADGTFDDFTVTDVDEGTLTSQVQLGGAPTVDWGLNPSVVRYQFPFYAPDPLRYGARVSVSTGFPSLVGGLEYDLYTDGAGADLGYLDYGAASTTGVVELSNEGTADSWPQFSIVGPVDEFGFEIVTVGTGARLVFVGEVPAGSTLVLDAATGAAVIDGEADRGGLLTYRDWAPVPAGGSAQFAFTSLGSSSAAVMTVSVRPAWW